MIKTQTRNTSAQLAIEPGAAPAKLAPNALLEQLITEAARGQAELKRLKELADEREERIVTLLRGLPGGEPILAVRVAGALLTATAFKQTKLDVDAAALQAACLALPGGLRLRALDLLLPRKPHAPAIREVIEGSELPEARAAVRSAVTVKSSWQLKLTVKLA